MTERFEASTARLLIDRLSRRSAAPKTVLALLEARAELPLLQLFVDGCRSVVFDESDSIAEYFFLSAREQQSEAFEYLLCQAIEVAPETTAVVMARFLSSLSGKDAAFARPILQKLQPRLPKLSLSQAQFRKVIFNMEALECLLLSAQLSTRAVGKLFVASFSIFENAGYLRRPEKLLQAQKQLLSHGAEIYEDSEIAEFVLQLTPNSLGVTASVIKSSTELLAYVQATDAAKIPREMALAGFETRCVRDAVLLDFVRTQQDFETLLRKPNTRLSGCSV